MPREPFVSSSNLRTSGMNICASASVTSVRYRPFSRSAGRPTSTPAPKQTTAATRNVQPGDHAWSLTRMAVMYAPTPKNAEWPMEIWPVKPINRLSDSAASASTQMSASWPYSLGRRSRKIGSTRT